MWTNLKTVFGIDLRALALFRVMLGLYVVVDLLNRWPHLRALYTDYGILSRAESMAFSNPARWSLLYLNGSPWMAHFFFAALLVAAFCLMIGYRTRIATFVCWVLVISITNRNLLVLQGDDDLSCILLFWGLFLPLGARFSIDDALRKEHEAPQDANTRRSHDYFSVATVAMLLQVSYVYIFGAFLKTGPEWTQNHDAVYYALSADSVSTALGGWLAGQGWLIQPLTRSVYWLELLMPFYIFSPVFFKPVRLIGLIALVGMHLGFAIFLSVGLFPLASIASLTLLVPAYAFDWAEKRWEGSNALTPWTLYYDDGCGFCRKTCLILRSFSMPYETRILPAQSDPVAGPILERETSWVVKDSAGELHTKWSALMLVLEQSPLTWLKAKIWGLLPQSAGNRIYGAIGDGRGALSGATAFFLPHRPLWTGLATPLAVVVIALTVFVFVWNVDRDPKVVLELPQSAERFAKAIRINQRWGMFAPSPIKLEGWYGFEGTLSDGHKIDLWTGEHGFPPADAPQDIHAWNKDYRWRKYFTRLHKKAYAPQRKNLARYWCRQEWTDKEGSPARLKKVKMIYYGRYTQPDNRPDRLKTFLLYNKSC